MICSHSSMFLITKCLKLIKYEKVSLEVLVSFKICCKSPNVRVINKLSLRLKTSISLGIL